MRRVRRVAHVKVSQDGAYALLAPIYRIKTERDAVALDLSLSAQQLEERKLDHRIQRDETKLLQ